MVRPRLVEEGEPIGYDETANHEERDVNSSPPVIQSSLLKAAKMLQDEEMAESPDARRPLVKAAGTSSASSKPSSLQLAAQGKAMRPVPPPRRRSSSTQYRIVIGGESQANERQARQDNSMEVEAESEPNYTKYNVASMTREIPLSAYRPTASRSSSWSSTGSSRSTNGRPSVVARSSFSDSSERRAPRLHRCRYEIGADERPVERMEGVQDHSTQSALVVMDGANLAYHYAQSLSNSPALEGESYYDAMRSGRKTDVRGIRVACQYFIQANIRVLVVLPASWLRRKPQAGDASSDSNALMQTEQLDVLEDLQRRGWLVAAPPTDDDDAYVLTIARREAKRGAAFCLSNDLFRDAQERDASLGTWLKEGTSAETGPGRMSYTFYSAGRRDEFGDKELELVPNPRHPLVRWIETNHQAAK